MENPNSKQEENSSSPIQEGKTFKKFLEDNTNLLTIFGIFNALAIWASGLDNTEYKNWLSVTFLLLSTFPFFEILGSLHEITPKKLKYHAFETLMFLAQLGIIFFIFETFTAFFGVMAIMILALLLLSIITVIIYVPIFLIIKFAKINQEKSDKIVMLICLLLSLFPTKLLLAYILGFIDTTFTFLK